MTSIITFLLIIFSALIIVWVLFKFLRSDASKTNRGYQLKGAAAGFVVILGFIMTSYTLFFNSIPMSKHKEIVEQLELKKWTIFADIEIGDDSDLEKISVVYVPEKPLFTIDSDAVITLSDVLVAGEIYPEMKIKCEGYRSYPLKINEDRDYYRIDKQAKTIKCLLPIKLDKNN